MKTPYKRAVNICHRVRVCPDLRAIIMPTLKQSQMLYDRCVKEQSLQPNVPEDRSFYFCFVGTAYMYICVYAGSKTYTRLKTTTPQYTREQYKGQDELCPASLLYSKIQKARLFGETKQNETKNSPLFLTILPHFCHLTTSTPASTLER